MSHIQKGEGLPRSYNFNITKKQIDPSNNGNKSKKSEPKPQKDKPSEYNSYLLGLRLVIEDSKEGQQSKKEKALSQIPSSTTQGYKALIGLKDFLDRCQNNIERSESDFVEEEVGSLEQLLDPEVDKKFIQIIDLFEAHHNIDKEDEKSERRRIDIDSEEISTLLDGFSDSLITSIEKKNGIALSEERKNQIRGQVDFTFINKADELNAKSFIEDTREAFQKDPGLEMNRRGLVSDLAKKYQLTENESKLLLELIKPNRFSLKKILETLKNANHDYGLSKDKVGIAKASSFYLVASGLFSLGSVFRAHPLAIPVSNLFNIGASYARRAGDKSKASLLEDIHGRVNQKVADALMYQEFEDLDSQKFAEVHTKLSQGKIGVHSIFNNIVGEITPRASLLAMNSAFMTTIHPLLGAVSAFGIGQIIRNSNKFADGIQANKRRERESQEHNTDNIKTVIDSGEEVLLAPNKAQAHEELKKGLDQQDHFLVEKEEQEANMFTTLDRTFFANNGISSAIAAAMWTVGNPETVGKLGEKAGFAPEQITALIPEGLEDYGISTEQALAAASLSIMLNAPFTQLLVNLQTRFKTEIQQIQDMEELLSQGELEMPEGEAEEGRISRHELDSKDISISGLKFKNILDDVNMEVKEGEFIAITGLSGSGKTTLVKNLLGLYKADAGKITIGGVEIDSIKRHGSDGRNSMISYCSQSPHYISSNSLRENLLLYSAREGISDEEIQAVMKKLKLDKYIDRLDDKLEAPSGGERLRLGIARVILRDGDILILDEPTSALDKSTRDDVIDLLTNIQKDFPDKTILCITHTEEVMEASSRVYDLTRENKASKKTKT